MTLAGVALNRKTGRWVAYWTGPGVARHVTLPLRPGTDREQALAAAAAQGPVQADLWLAERARGETAQPS
jgi:hypothetical protein